MGLEIEIGFELGLEVTGKSTVWSNGRKFTCHRVDNALHLQRRKQGVTREHSKDEFVSQSDDQTAGTRLIGVFSRFVFVPVLTTLSASCWNTATELSKTIVAQKSWRIVLGDLPENFSILFSCSSRQSCRDIL